MKGEFPIFYKSLIAFSHPVLMLIALLGAFYALYLGIQTRKTRTADAEIRKQLIKEKFNQKHFQVGSILLAVWVIGGIGGMAATYTLYQKLFVSPHLIIGLSSLCLAALAAALAPLMQQGKEWARIIHMTCTTTLIGLILAQAWTGVQITQKMLNEILGRA